MTYLLTLAMLLAGQAPADSGAAKSDAPAAKSKSTAAEKKSKSKDGAKKSETDGAATKKADEKGDAEPSADAKADVEGDEETDEDESAGFSLDEILDSGAIGLLRQGGFFMWPILIMGIVAAGVIIERYRSLKMLTTDTVAMRSEVRELLEEDRVEEALHLCDSQKGPVPAILSSGLRKFLVLRRLNYDPGRIEEQVVKAMDDYSIHIVAALERHLSVLATVSSVAPMLGFLGTVQGMIVAFQDIVEKMGETNIVEAAAAGISVALLTTCFGLIIGIPAFMAFNYFTSVINRFVLDVEESATELIETVTLHMALEGQAGESDNGPLRSEKQEAAESVPVTADE